MNTLLQDGWNGHLLCTGTTAQPETELAHVMRTTLLTKETRIYGGLQPLVFLTHAPGQLCLSFLSVCFKVAFNPSPSIKHSI